MKSLVFTTKHTNHIIFAPQEEDDDDGMTNIMARTNVIVSSVRTLNNFKGTNCDFLFLEMLC